jgi:hypothetical protein
MDGGWQRLKVAKSHGRLSRVLAEIGHSPCRPLLTQNLMAAADPQTHIEIVSDVPPGTSKLRPQLPPELGPNSSMFWRVLCTSPANYHKLPALIRAKRDE